MVRKTTVALVVVAAAGLAVIAVPQLVDMRGRCCGSFEVGAISTLRSVQSSQERFRDARCADVDDDGVGEFGFLAELAGAAALPGKTDAIRPPVLSGVFRNVGLDGIVRRSGYLFRVFLPDVRGDGVAEVGYPPEPPRSPPPSDVGSGCWSGSPRPILPSRAAPTDRVDPKLASRKWCAYAWPAKYDERGARRTFFIDADGRFLSTADPRYSGANGPSPGAAYASGGATSIIGEHAVGRTAQDGNVWTSLR
jgi:hypothetical protein